MTLEAQLKEALAAYGKASLLCTRQDEELRMLRQMVDQLRLDIHHLDIALQTANADKAHIAERFRAQMEKAETVKVPAILPTDEYDLQDELTPMAPTKIIRPFQGPGRIEVERGNPPHVI